MNKKLHITIGIPAFNEEANIANLLTSLCKQSRSSFVLDKILVVSDGSTDATVSIVNKLSKKYKQVVCVDDKVRRGVRFRTQQLINKNRSEVLVFMDGDTMPQNSQTISRLVSVFNNKSVKLATANIQPIKPNSQFEHFLFAWRRIWFGVIQTWKEGNNIYSFRGVGIAIRKGFSKSINIPTKLTGATSHFIYLTAKQRGLKTAFCPQSVIYYRLAKSLQDYLLQLNRGQKDGQLLRARFSKIVNAEYVIPKKLLLYTIFKGIITKPVETIMGLGFNIVVTVVNRNPHPSDSKGIWQIAQSTKNLTAKANQ